MGDVGESTDFLLDERGFVWPNTALINWGLRLLVPSTRLATCGFRGDNCRTVAGGAALMGDVLLSLGSFHFEDDSVRIAKPVPSR